MQICAMTLILPFISLDKKIKQQDYSNEYPSAATADYQLYLGLVHICLH